MPGIVKPGSANESLISQVDVTLRVLEQLMVDSVAVLLHQELITLETVAQDGMKVRAQEDLKSWKKIETYNVASEAASHGLPRPIRKRVA